VDDDVFFETSALYLVDNSACWRAIERIAFSVVQGPITGPEVREIVEDVAGEQQIIFPAAEDLG